MTKLSDLIKVYNELNTNIDQLLITDIVDEKVRFLNNIVLNNNLSQVQEGITLLINKYQQLTNNSSMVNDGIKTLLLDIQTQIDIQAEELIQSQQNNQIDTTIFGFSDFRKVDLPDSIQNTLSGCVNFRYPGLQLYPSITSWISAMAACDPLYLFAGDLHFLNLMIKDFPEQYQKRLRLYQNLDDLPQNQFGVILVWEFFNCIPFTSIKSHLSKFFCLLRPGGTLIFNYNNCDIHSLAVMAETHNLNYAGERLLTKTCIELGYDIIKIKEEKDGDKILSWMQVSKPGKLDTVKKSQAIGAIYKK